MSLPTKLAKLTTESMSFQPSTCGIPTLTHEIVAGSLGYAESQIPSDRTGVHLVLAKCIDDEISKDTLEKTMPPLAREMWWELECSGPITATMITNISKLAILDFFSPCTVSAPKDIEIAKSLKVDFRTWRSRYHHIYVYLVGAMYQLGDPVLMELSKELREPDD